MLGFEKKQTNKETQANKILPKLLKTLKLAFLLVGLIWYKCVTKLGP